MKVIFLLLAFNLLFSQRALAQDESIRITEGEFAVMIVKVAGYEDELPPEPEVEDYILVLRRHGIEPLDGWNPKRTLTIGRFSTVMIQARGLEKPPINDADKCLQQIFRINRVWFEIFQREKRWFTLKELMQPVNFEGEVPKCPFGRPYVDADGDHLIDLHDHRGFSRAVENYVETLKKKTKEERLLMPKGSPRQAVSLAQAQSTLKDLAGLLAPARPILTEATPIRPRDMPHILGTEKGRLVFVIYEKGSLRGRKIEWPAEFDPALPLNITVTYSNQAKLPGNKSIRVFVNNVEVGSAEGKWSGEGFYNPLWIGAQSQTGQFPSNSYLYNLRVYRRKIETDPMGLKRRDIILESRLDEPTEITSPRIRARYLKRKMSFIKGEIPEHVLKVQDRLFVKKLGFISEEKNQYVILPAVLDPEEGSFSIVIKPGFVYSDREHVFLSNVKWDSPEGASGFYLYYQPVG